MRKLFLLFISLCFSILIGEILVAKFIPQKTYSQAYAKGYSCFSRSDTAVFTLKPNCTIPFTDFDTGLQVPAHINNFGYRGVEFDQVKKPDEKRILFEGDSFILGFGVSDTDVVTARLEKLLHNTTVINAGYAGGFGPDGYFLHLKHAGMDLMPDLVIFSIFVFNDLSDLAENDWLGVGAFGEPEKIVSKTTVVDSGGYLVPRDRPFIYRIPIARDSHLAVLAGNGVGRLQQFLKQKYERVYFALFPPTIPTGNATDSNLPGIYISTCIFADTCHRRPLHLYSDLFATIQASENLVSKQFIDSEVHFLVLLIPAEFQLYAETNEKYQDAGIPKDSATIQNPNPQKRIKEFLDMKKIAYLDLLPAMRKEKERLTFIKDGHWNPKGHMLAARELYLWIRSHTPWGIPSGTPP